jgi:diguanylate cyclase (GGDEF)-like protein
MDRGVRCRLHPSRREERFVSDSTASPDAAEALIRAASAVATSGDIDAVLGSLLDIATGATGADRAAILLHDPDRAQADLAASVGAPPSEDDMTAAVEVLGTREPRTRTFRAGASAKDVPLVVSREGIDQAVGVATFQFASRPPEGADRLLRAVADLAAVAVDRARLASLVAERSEWYERMAHSDPLTGLANQRTFGRVLELELARAGRQGGEVSVAVFDIDGFVEVNEGAGREAGDDLLRAVAVVLNESVRLVDTVARFGGDEFVLVAPGSAGTTVAGRVLAGVAALQPIGGKAMSASAGVAKFPTDGTTADELLDAALHALASARKQGSGTLAEAGSQRTA